MAGLLRHSLRYICRPGRRQRHQAGIERSFAPRGCHSDQRWRLGERARPRRRRTGRTGLGKAIPLRANGPGQGDRVRALENVPVFCLPGGPLSNEMAFLQFALPALVRMEGDTRPPLQIVHARLAEDVKSRHRAWTEFKDAASPLMSGVSMPWRSTEAGAESRRSPGRAGSSAFRRARSGCVAARSYPCNCSQGLDDGCPPSG